MKKFLFLFLLPIIFLLPKNTFANSGSNWQQLFSVDENGTIITVDGLNTFNVSHGVKFTYYQFRFQDTSLEKGKTYHIRFSIFGEIPSGFYSLDPTLYEFYSFSSNGSTEIEMLNLSMNGTGQYRTIEFDFFNPTDNKTFYLAATNPNGVLYYSYSSDSKFGWYALTINKLADSEDAIINQNDMIIGQNQTIINQNQTIIDNTNNTNNLITSEESPDLDALEDSAGWLPPGPVDSILNLPLNFFNNLVSNLQKTCHPVNVLLPFVNTNLTLPCISTLYEQIGATTFLNWVGLIVGTIILYNYLISLYKWVDDTIQMKDTTDDWGGV